MDSSDTPLNFITPPTSSAVLIDAFGISKERVSRPTHALRARLRLMRMPTVFLRHLLPTYGRMLDRQLGNAIENCSTRGAKFCLIFGADPQALMLPNMNVLARCARLGHSELIVWLAACGANPNASSTEKWTPMHHASFKGHACAIYALAAAGADVSAKANYGFTPMLLACKENRVESVEALCLLGASTDDADERGEPPLLLCARRGFDEAARMLLSHGARVDLTERRGFQAIHLAASHGYDTMCQLLLDAGARPDAPGPWSKTPLAIARAEGHASTFALIEHAFLQGLGRPDQDAVDTLFVPASRPNPRRL